MWVLVSSWRSLPASITRGAGARPDHSISGPPDLIQSPETRDRSAMLVRTRARRAARCVELVNGAECVAGYRPQFASVLLKCRQMIQRFNAREQKISASLERR